MMKKKLLLLTTVLLISSFAVLTAASADEVSVNKVSSGGSFTINNHGMGH